MSETTENPSTTSTSEPTIKSSFYPTTPLTRKWWKESIAYQIYPRSFQDSNGDGIGDIRGIIQRLDHIKNLGIDVIWICPIFKSPNDDNGYDVSDFQAIMDLFGTMADVEEMIKEIHDRNMRVIFDLVLNHTSDEHPWFIESRSSRTNPKRDWYIWRDGKPGGLRPNNWESIFNGSAWEYDKETDQYYLHLFSRKMPDVNWECQELREELYKIARWWLERGVDGFRIDAISHIKKKTGLPDLPNPKHLEFVSSFDYHMNVEGIEYFLNEFKRETYGKLDVFTVGEANGVTAEQAIDWVDEERGIFNMIFQFEGTNLWEKTLGSLDVLGLKRIMTRWQKSLEKTGWNALFLENHDKPRIVSTWGNDKEHWRECATAFATFYMLMMGTPFIYQGQEIGMTNVRFPSITDYPDVAARNFYNLQLAKGIDHNELMQIIYVTGRDNSRTPMQWDDSLYAGFTTAQQAWIGINPNYVRINVAQQEKDENSVLNFYKRLIRLRKENDIFVYGIYDLILSHHKQIYGYTRTSDTKRAYILTNLTDRVAQFTLFHGLSSSQLILSNLLEPISEHQNEKTFKFHPFESRVYIIDHKKKDIGSTLSTMSQNVDETDEAFAKRRRSAAKKLEKASRTAALQSELMQKDILAALAVATTKALSEGPTSDTSALKLPRSKSIAVPHVEEKLTPKNSPEIDSEDEPIHKKRERQRSLVLNLESITPVVQPDPSPVDQHRQSFSTQSSQLLTKLSFMGHHADSSSDDDDEKDIDYTVLYDDTIDDFRFTSAPQLGEKGSLTDQQEMVLPKEKEPE